MLIETWGVWDGLAWVLWGAGQDQGLWAVEGGRVADLASLVGVGLRRYCQLEFSLYFQSSSTYTLEGSLRGIVGLLVTLAGLRGTTCCYASAIALERTRNSCCCCAYVYPPLQRPSDLCLCCAKTVKLCARSNDPPGAESPMHRVATRYCELLYIEVFMAYQSFGKEPFCRSCRVVWSVSLESRQSRLRE